MKRLSLKELKSKKADVKKLEAIKGGTVADCHAWPKPDGNMGGSGIEKV